MSTEHLSAWQRADLAEECLAHRQVVLPLIDVHEELVRPDWMNELLEGGAFDAVVSSYAIHRLTSERKRAPFGEVFELLAPGAMFVNMDVVAIEGPLAGLFDERIADVHARAAHVHNGGAERGGPDAFEDSAEDRPDPLSDQLAWLHETGFEQVEVHFKRADGTIFGATKPEGRA